MKVSFTKGQLQAAIKTCPKLGGWSSLTFVRIENNKLLSTDGHRLSIVPIEGDASCDDAPRHIHRNEAERIAKMMTARSVAVMEWETGDPISLAIDGRPCGTVADEEVTFPDYAKVIPSAEPELSIGFDAHYLRDLCDAAIATDTSGKKVCPIRIDMTDALSAAKFVGSGVTVVLMPCRL